LAVDIRPENCGLAARASIGVRIGYNMPTPTNPYQSPNPAANVDAVLVPHAVAVREIPFSGSMSVADAFAAASLAVPRGRKTSVWIARCLLAYGLLHMGAVAAYSAYRGKYGVTLMATAVFAVLLLIVAFAVGRTAWVRHRANRLWREGKGLFERTEGRVTSDGIESKTMSTFVALQWSAFCGYRMSDRIVVLYRAPSGPSVLMARSKFATDEDWGAFLEMVGTRLPKV
jgi:hypothetical protein